MLVANNIPTNIESIEDTDCQRLNTQNSSSANAIPIAPPTNVAFVCQNGWERLYSANIPVPLRTARMSSEPATEIEFFIMSPLFGDQSGILFTSPELCSGFRRAFLTHQSYHRQIKYYSLTTIPIQPAKDCRLQRLWLGQKVRGFPSQVCAASHRQYFFQSRYVGGY